MVRKVWQNIPAALRVNLIWYWQKKFTVSVAAIIINPDRKILLLNHMLRPLSPWGIPGGFIDPKEQPADAIRRELREETGIELDDLQLYRVRTIGRHVEILFTARSADKAEVKSREIIELGWYTPGEMPTGTSKVQSELIREVLAAGFDKKPTGD